ncbi:hypothetical protein [Aurantivibrio plasticivorans]
MKSFFRKLFFPILSPFESGTEPYSYKPLNRKVLIVVGILFLGLSLFLAPSAIKAGDIGYLLPLIVFSGAGLVCTVVGLLGNDRAVCKIWGNR